MSDLRRKTENNKVRNMAVLNPVTQLSVWKMNRLVLAIIISLMATVVFMGMLLMPENEIVPKTTQVHKSTELYNVQMNPVISAEVDALKSQLVGLVSGSIESKLNTLEEGLKAGTITEIGLDTIEALKDDLVVLKTYSETGAGRLIAQKYLQQANKAENKNLAQEVSQLRSMIYFLITSCGLMVAAVASVWVRRKYALIHDVDKQKKIS
ncbi:hypothetical protein [methanotrophic endosymbiont of Bathymodiolus puteoserpentis (Logatchev)]|jgi:hypothetical protein|uniref:hypothetical protein n=1 Tax=methanotrophic endosymbiont of Bathymodiolus puteoserpentis (Logatchev) TaxID=343235 RepID=UPI0013C736BB|nr:hypothetical protein [methanotrophic endosymbiont of Bathymodiolus puteoserpentis (Logatchev)]SHE22905.1 hypothetical protein BPUTEOMOX_972 [methanotrophic endosymbiont of Bathymodiolus puteoserpentis (Logatchev)]